MWFFFFLLFSAFRMSFLRILVIVIRIIMSNTLGLFIFAEEKLVSFIVRHFPNHRSRESGYCCCAAMKSNAFWISGGIGGGVGICAP